MGRKLIKNDQKLTLKIMPQIGSQIINKMGSEILKYIGSIVQENLSRPNLFVSCFLIYRDRNHDGFFIKILYQFNF
jgi:hypothetical protein